VVAAATLIAGAAHADLPVPWVPKNAEEAAVAASAPIVPVRTLELRPAFTDIHTGGNASSLVIRTDLPMPYALVPGLRLGKIYSILRIDLPVISLNTPQLHATGLGDTTVFDSGVYPFRHGAVLVGIGMILPSATNAALGLGQLQLGPSGGIAWAPTRRLGLSVLAANFFSVASATPRPPIDVLALQPWVVVWLPRAFFLLSDPILTFDWNRGGHATVPVNLAAGHAFTHRLVLSLEPEWIATGDGRNNGLIRATVTYLGW
jgi:hypothetical protein